MADAAKHTTIGVNDSQSAAAELARMASELQTLVGKFKIEQRATDRGATSLQRLVAVGQDLKGSAGNAGKSKMDQLRTALRELIAQEKASHS